MSIADACTMPSCATHPCGCVVTPCVSYMEAWKQRLLELPGNCLQSTGGMRNVNTNLS